MHYLAVWERSHENISAHSGLHMGALGNDPPEKGVECGDTWCSDTRNSRYNGTCQNNSKGIGDWMLFVR